MSDFERYATGYQLTDWLTAPYWRYMCWRAERSLDKALGITGSRRERREQRRELWQLVGPVDAVAIDSHPPHLCLEMCSHNIPGVCTEPAGHTGPHVATGKRRGTVCEWSR